MSKKYDEMRKAAAKKGLIKFDPTPEQKAELEKMLAEAPVGEIVRIEPAKEKRKPRPDRSAAGRDARVNARGRLPGFSQVFATYDEARGMWVGSLQVPYKAHETDTCTTWHVVKHEADGLFRLMEEMDDQYRLWLAEREANK